VDLLLQGLNYRGVTEFERKNFGKAYDALKSAGSYRDSLFQMAEIVRQTSQPITEIAAHYWAAYDGGDKGALPWLCTIEEGITFDSKIEHPRFKEITADLAALREARNPDIARELSRLSFQIGELRDGVRYLTAAVLLGDTKSRILLFDILAFGPTMPEYFEYYNLILDTDVFDFEGFPFKPNLIPIVDSTTLIEDGEPEMSEEMFNLLSWLYQQEDSSSFTPGLFGRLLWLELSKAQSYDFIMEYHNRIIDSFGYQNSSYSDISHLFDLARHLLSVGKAPNLGVYNYLSMKFGVDDLFDEMIKEIMETSQGKLTQFYYNDIHAFKYSSDFSLKSAFTRIPTDFDLPSLKEFILCVETLNFDIGEEIFSKVLTDAKSGVEGACLELANLLEFTDRLRFDFDVLPKRFIAFVFDSVFMAIKEKTSGALRRTLIEFKPNGERPYYMDDLEYELVGNQK